MARFFTFGGIPRVGEVETRIGQEIKRRFGASGHSPGHDKVNFGLGVTIPVTE